MEIEVILLIVLFHFVSDFLLQTEEMANNKSTSNKWLTIHVTCYSIPFIAISPLYALINGVLHFITDYITSRITKRLWAEKKVGLFFKVIGFDQAIHMSTLFGTYYLMFV